MADHDPPRARFVVLAGELVVATGSVPAGVRCDLRLVDLLLRLRLEAERLALTVRLTEVDPELRELLHLVGMDPHGHPSWPRRC